LTKDVLLEKRDRYALEFKPKVVLELPRSTPLSGGALIKSLMNDKLAVMSRIRIGR
jgi:hypothetical protein